MIFEICDTCPKVRSQSWTMKYFDQNIDFALQSLEDLPSPETLNWADGVVLVYSITERGSFNFVKQVWNIFQVSSQWAVWHIRALTLSCLQDVRSSQSKEVPMVLLGNKGDMVHLRQVSSEEGMWVSVIFSMSWPSLYHFLAMIIVNLTHPRRHPS